MRSIPEFEGHSASSAGAVASPGSAICARVDARIWAIAPEGADFARRHASRVLTAEIIGASSLILTASKAERAAVARLDPSARPRTFTLREAVALAGDGDLVAAQNADGTVLDRFAAAIHARRGLTVPPTRPARSSFGRWFGSRETADPLDVVDGHVAGDQRHETALDDVTAAVDGLLEAFRRFTA